MKYFLLIVLWLLISPQAILANEVLLEDILKKPVLTQADRDELYRRGYDDPETFFPRLVGIWNQSSSDQNKLLKARTGWFIGFFATNVISALSGFDVPAILSETEQLVMADRLPIPTKEIHFLKTRYEILSGKSEFMTLKDDFLRLAHELDERKLKAHALGKIAYLLSMREPNHKEIPPLIHEAQKLLGQLDDTASAIDLETWMTISAGLKVLEQQSELDTVAKKMLAVCEQKKIRGSCSAVYYNAGAYLIQKKDYASAKPYIFKALELAGQIQDKENLATSYYALIVIFNKEADFKSAIGYAQKAAYLFEELKQPDWQALAMKSMSESYRLSRQPKQALIAAEKALNLSPPEYKDDRLNIYKELAEVHNALEQFEKAFHYLSTFVDLQKELLTEDASKKYMQLRNQTLSEQNELQAQQIHLLNKFRIVSIVAGSLALLVCGALFIVGRQASVIRRSRQKMKEVLDHIEEGILVLGEDLRIKSGYSPHLDKIFSRKSESLADKLSLELLFPAESGSADQGVIARETL
ncbi:MAG: hypothetical protein M3Q07_05990, partial [Pseudobdellovibrionaceae bacterium]|nr:hypothetical protein [Pseudobdellovibrionaceae bacterium]